MRCAADFVWHRGLDGLPAQALALFADPQAGLEAVYDSLDWYRLLIRAAVPPGAEPLFGLGRIEGQIAAVLPVWRLAQGELVSLASPYTCAHRILLRPGLREAELTALGCALAGLLRREDGLRLEALPPDWPPLAALLRGVRQGGLLPLGFAHFGAWSAALPAGGWPAYLASRDGRLRETIRRRTARLGREPGFRFEMVAGGAALEPGIVAFETVYAASWKAAEPYPDFNAAFMRDAAARDQLRLAILWQHDQPVAVQYWLLANRQAQVLKLAQNAAFDAYSPGTVLTAWAIERMITEDGLTRLNFGRGDDGYKQLWVGERAQRIGIMLANPRRMHGLASILRHAAGWLRRTISGLRRGRIAG